MSRLGSTHTRARWPPPSSITTKTCSCGGVGAHWQCTPRGPAVPGPVPRGPNWTQKDRGPCGKHPSLATKPGAAPQYNAPLQIPNHCPPRLPQHPHTPADMTPTQRGSPRACPRSPQGKNLLHLLRGAPSTEATRPRPPPSVTAHVWPVRKRMKARAAAPRNPPLKLSRTLKTSQVFRGGTLREPRGTGGTRAAPSQQARVPTWRRGGPP